MDQRSIDASRDVLFATTEPVERDVEIVGEPTATVWASSTSTDFDVIVRVSVVTPGGPVLLVTDGVRRARFANGFDKITPVTPGTPVKLDVELGPMSVKLTKGQSLRVAIQGTSAPRYEANPGVAEPIASSPKPVTSTLTIHVDPTHPTSITLPTEGFASTATPEPDAGPAPNATTTSEGGCGCSTAPASQAPWMLITLAALRAATRRRRA